MAGALSPTMTLREFESGYWYLAELKDFADRIGIPAAQRLRKDELEKAILTFLRTGKAALPTKRSFRKAGVKDLDRGLRLGLRIEHYTSNRATKDFIAEQARRTAPEVREKSGVWYRLNRWREEQLTSGKRPTYGGPRSEVRCPEQDGAIREDSSRSLHQLRRRIPRKREGRDPCRGDRRLGTAKTIGRVEELCFLGQGACAPEEAGRVTVWPSSIRGLQRQ